VWRCVGWRFHMMESVMRGVRVHVLHDRNCDAVQWGVGLMFIPERNRDAWVRLIWEKSWCVGWAHSYLTSWGEIMRRCECSCVLHDGKRDALLWPRGSCFFIIEIVMRCVGSRFCMTEIRAHVLHSRNRYARCGLAFYMTEIVMSCVGSRAPFPMISE
jgi:hypothetical protein